MGQARMHTCEDLFYVLSIWSSVSILKLTEGKAKYAFKHAGDELLHVNSFSNL